MCWAFSLPMVHEERVRDLTEMRVMASVPYGGRYRPCRLPALQYGQLRPQQGRHHHRGELSVADGPPRLRQGLGPFEKSAKASTCCRRSAKTVSRTDGKIESLDSIRRFLKNSLDRKYVLLSDCDTVCNIDYREAISQHVSSGADITIIYRHGDSPDVDRNTIFTLDPSGRIIEMLIHRGSERDVNYGMGMYIVGREKAPRAGRELHEPQRIRPRQRHDARRPRAEGHGL